MGHLIGDVTNKMIRDTRTLGKSFEEYYFSDQILKTKLTLWDCPISHSPYRHIVYSATIAEKSTAGNSNIEMYEIAVTQRSTDNNAQFAVQRNYQYYGGSFEYQTIYSGITALPDIVYTFKILSQYPTLTTKYQVWNGAIKVWDIELARYGTERGVTSAIQQLEYYGTEYHIMLDDVETWNTYWRINGNQITNPIESGTAGNKKFNFWYATPNIWNGRTVIP